MPLSRAPLPRAVARMLARALFGCVLLALGALVIPPIAVAGSVEVVSVGWNGTVVPGTWAPVKVRVSGTDQDVSARLDVVVKWRQPASGSPITIPDQVVGAYGQDVALPAGSTKELTIWVSTWPSQMPTADTQPGTVRLIAGNQVLAEQEIELKTGRTPQWPLVGVLAEAPTIERNVARVSISYQGLPIPVSVATLKTGDVPTSGERLKAFKGIVVQGSAPALLTGEQRQALKEWVVAGGNLVLTGGPDAARAAAALPDGTLPVSIGASSTWSLAPLAAWLNNPRDPVGVGPAANLEPRGGAVLLGADDEAASLGGTPPRPPGPASPGPLIWRIGLGEGTVTLLAADPALEPLASWPGSGALLQKLLEPALTSFSADGNLAFPQGDATSRLQAAVDALPPEAYPSLPLVALILGGFALGMGPVAHIVLRRLDRREWIWVLVPGSAVGLVAILYLVGIGHDGRDILGNVVADVDLTPESGGGHATIVAGYFSPTRPRLAVSTAGSDPIRVSTGGGYPGYGGYYGGYARPGIYPPLFPNPRSTSDSGDDVPFSVVTGRDTRVEYASGQWGMRTLALERALGSGIGQVTPSLRLEGNLVSGTVRNDTSLFLEDAAVLVGSDLAKLGNLAPGQMAPVRLDIPAAASAAAAGYQPLSYRLLGSLVSSDQAGPSSGVYSGYPPGTSYRPGGPYPGGERWELPRDPETVRRARLLDAISQPMGPYGGTLGGGRSLSLIALTRSSLGVPLPSAGVHPLHSLAVVQQRLSLDLPPGAFTMPAALTPSELLPNSAAQNLAVSSASGAPTMTAIYRYRPPVPPGTPIDGLELDFTQLRPLSQAIARPSIPFPAGVGPPGSGSSQNVPDSTVSVYNWQSGGWDPTPEGEERVRLDRADVYVSAEGEIRVQVKSTPRGPMEMMIPGLVVEGRVPA